jgi:hypothetical protein
MVCRSFLRAWVQDAPILRRRHQSKIAKTSSRIVKTGAIFADPGKRGPVSFIFLRIHREIPNKLAMRPSSQTWPDGRVCRAQSVVFGASA